MKDIFSGLSMSKVKVVLFIAAAIWTNLASAIQPAKLGYAETVIGGQLVLVEETCIFHGLGTGYALYLTNPRGTTIGKGCAIANALPSDLGMVMVQWGASPIQGAESYQLDGFTWTARGRIVMASVLGARQEAIAHMKAEKEAKAKEEASATTEATVMVAEFNRPDGEKTYLGVVRSKNYPPTILIIPKQCSLLVTEPDPSGKYGGGVMVRKNNGRTALGLSSNANKVVYRGCALPNSDRSISVRLDSDNLRFTEEQISWEPEGREWIEAEAAKGNQ